MVAAPIKSALRLTAVNAVASALGLKPGMALADARAMHPRLKAVDADPLADRQFLEAVADWCDRYTPLVGLHPPDGLILDISGCAHLFGGEARLSGDLVHRMRARGVQARAAVADTVGCAWAMAHYGDDGCIVPPGVTRDVLAPLPVAALRLAPDTVTLLGEVGLKRVADLLERPRAALAARFGAELIWRLDQALGRDDESITPRRPLPCYVAEQRFADPIALERDVLGTIGRLGQRVERTLTQHGEGARLLEIALYRVDGEGAAALGRHQPGDPRRRIDAPPVRRTPGRARRRARSRLRFRHDPPLGRRRGADSKTCRPDLARPTTGKSSPSWSTGSARASAFAACCASHRTTRIFRNSPRSRCGPTTDGQRMTRPSSVRRRSCSVPIKLFDRPEPIEAVAEVPDGPPVRFRWRRVLHEVARAEGPERIAMEWWRDDAGRTLTRDYFRVEGREGARFWLYREGLYAREAAQPRWFLHGLFA